MQVLGTSLNPEVLIYSSSHRPAAEYRHACTSSEGQSKEPFWPRNLGKGGCRERESQEQVIGLISSLITHKCT